MKEEGIIFANDDNDGHRQTQLYNYCKRTDYKGCYHKCPCVGRWINCNYYNSWKRYKNYWLEKWRNEQRYKEAHELLDKSMDFHINSIANG